MAEANPEKAGVAFGCGEFREYATGGVGLDGFTECQMHLILSMDNRDTPMFRKLEA